MKQPLVSFAALLSLGLGVSACLDDGALDKGVESADPVDDLAADSFAKPTTHGAIAFGTAPEATLTAAEKFHEWTFALTGPAQLRAFTGPATGGRAVDTVLYLYKRTATGTWGSYIAKNDDSGNS